MASFAAELPSEGQNLFVVGGFELLGYVAVFLHYSFFLSPSLLHLLVQPCLDLFLEGCQLGRLLGSQGVQSGLDLHVAGVEPCFLFCFLELCQPRLDFMSLCVST